MTDAFNNIDPLAEEIARRKTPSLWDSEAIGERLKQLIDTEKLTLDQAHQKLEFERCQKVAEVEDFLALILDTAEDETDTTADEWVLNAVRGARATRNQRVAQDTQ